MGHFETSNEHQLSSTTMAKAMKAMKAMAAMKAMKAMKKKAVSKIAKGKMARSVVFRGTKEKTLGGLTKSDVVQNKRGKIVTKKQAAAGKEGTECEGLRRCQEGYSSLQQGQGVVQLSASVWLLLRSWGYLRPSSAAASDHISIVEHLR